MTSAKAPATREVDVAVASVTVAVVSLGVAALVRGRPASSGGTVTAVLVMALLAGGIMVAYRYPLRLRHQATLQVTGVPMFLAVVLLAPLPAAVAVGIGIFSGEYTQRCRCSNPMTHVVIHAARLTVVTLIASCVAHMTLPIPHELLGVRWVGAGAVLWLGDFLTILALLVPITGRQPHALLLSLVRQAGTQEAAQYVMGLLSALAVEHNLWAMPLLVLPTALVYVALERANQRGEDIRVFLESMADTVDLRDPSTGGHSQRVARYVATILTEMRIGGRRADTIVWAARVHDIGKIGVPDHILNKPGHLTDQEWAIMAGHAEQGAQLLARYRDFSDGADIVRFHHERWDGSGYPLGLSGAETPLGARVVAVADAFDAMTMERPYGLRKSVQQAAAALHEGRGKQWDAAVVDAFLQSLGEAVDRSRLADVPVDVGEQAAIA